MERARKQLDAGQGSLKPHRDRSLHPHLRGRQGPNALRPLPVGSGIAESACNCIVRNRLKGAGRHWPKAGANPLPAIGWGFENMRGPNSLEWRACRAAGAQPKKMDRTQSEVLHCEE